MERETYSAKGIGSFGKAGCKGNRMQVIHSGKGIDQLTQARLAPDQPRLSRISPYMPRHGLE